DETFYQAKQTGSDWSTWYSSGIPWVSGHRYWVKSRATDKAGNVEALFNVSVNTNTFVYDNTVPQVGITIPSALRYNSLPTISGTSSDNVGATAVKLRVWNKNAGFFWDPTSSQTSPVFNKTASNPTAWFISTPTVGGDYSV